MEAAEKSLSLRLSKDLLDPKWLKFRSARLKAPVLALTLFVAMLLPRAVGATAKWLRWPSLQELSRTCPPRWLASASCY